MASEASTQAVTLSITGVTFPDLMRLCMLVRSSLFSFAINIMNFWLTSRENVGAVITRVRKNQAASLGAPSMTHMPPGFRAQR
jgi:hypothetical protein